MVTSAFRSSGATCRNEGHYAESEGVYAEMKATRRYGQDKAGKQAVLRHAVWCRLP
jgi:hypothetical protein